MNLCGKITCYKNALTLLVNISITAHEQPSCNFNHVTRIEMIDDLKEGSYVRVKKRAEHTVR